MAECKCINCRTVYTINENEADDGYCCFDCWEEVNCLEPEEYQVSIES